MKPNYGLSVGDEVRVKGNTIGCGKIKTLLPKGYGGKDYALAEVYWSTDWNFTIGLIKVFALRDLVRRKEVVE